MTKCLNDFVSGSKQNGSEAYFSTFSLQGRQPPMLSPPTSTSPHVDLLHDRLLSTNSFRRSLREVELEAKFEDEVSKIKRDIVFAASLF
ncbi:hypothetical protein L6452_42071 [Arctium lappa]|uniref:Uncharacterized protein n=1 Tax=Arctium lappa TaxID=4217 RepID=A0ACB8XHR2_ARCLA|nr:hypothetical protein L6452_42071 [Arctium lappa]